MTPAFHPVLPFSLIQGIRLAHALMESKFDVCIPVQHTDKFLRIKEKFNVDFREGAMGVKCIEDFKIDHSSPKTSIGSIDRPLIFPHSIINHCRTLWDEKRGVEVSFAGLITKKRKRILSEYVKNNFGKEKYIGNVNPINKRLKNKLRKMFGIGPKSYSIEVGNLEIRSSTRGREFPIKAWDERYFNLLSRSKFVICPNGDYVWSYRFFESILCGAIPIIEESCEAYDDFFYYKIEDKYENLKWDMDKVHSNYKKCSKRVSVPLDKINNEIDKLMYG